MTESDSQATNFKLGHPLAEIIGFEEQGCERHQAPHEDVIWGWLSSQGLGGGPLLCCPMLTLV
jgi:hypothetical protein